MPLKIVHLISRQAVFDAGITARDVLRRLQSDSQSASVLSLPPELLRPWITARRHAPPDTALFFHLHFAEISKAFSHSLELLLLDKGPSGNLAVGTSLSRLFTLATGCLASKLDLELPERLATLIKKCYATELAILGSLESSQRGDDQTGRITTGLQRFHPRLFCLAWYLAWRQQALSPDELHRVYRALAICFASALGASYVAYAQLVTRDGKRRALRIG